MITNLLEKLEAIPEEYERGQAVEITSGKYTGHKARFNGLIGDDGQHCLVWIGGGSNLHGARLSLADIQPQEQEV